MTKQDPQKQIYRDDSELLTMKSKKQNIHNKYC